ncbi:MAG: NAD(P)H-dependent glycerol-3-phosphate dehydrogenase, partial [Thermomicrobiales bacterium]
MMAVTVLGAGSWGTTLAMIAARAGNPAVLWARDGMVAAAIQERRRNERYLPEVEIPVGVTVLPDLERALSGARIVVFAVPCAAM